MARGSTRRTWVKLHCDGILNGSIAYQLEEAEQAVWMKLIAFAGVINRDGQISDNDGRPFPRQFIMHRINTTEDHLESTLKKCITEGRITEDEQGLHITNWKIYQSEYNRQKPYREAGKDPTKEASDQAHRDRQAELDNRLQEDEFTKISQERQKEANRWRAEHPYE